MTEFTTILMTRHGSVVTVALNRPDVHNAFNATVIAELTATFGELSVDESVSVVILKGEGRSFCAGADVNWMRESLDLTEAENLEDARRMSDMFAAIDNCPQAIVARVHGAALGGGMGLLAVCDTVVAADDCKFGFTESRLGIIPAVISRFVIPKIGQSWARRLFLSGERFDAARAREIGLVHDVVFPEDLDRSLDHAVRQLEQAGPKAIREAKALIRGVVTRDSEQWRDFTAAQIARVRTSPEGQEGLRAFLEKREPSWRAHG